MNEAVQRASRVKEEEASLQVFPIRFTGNKMSLVPNESHQRKEEENKRGKEKANATTYQANTQ